MQFCNDMNIPPVPIDDRTVCLYAVYLARRLKPSSIRQYLNIVRLIHLECGYANPCKDNWMLKATLMGIDRLLGKESNSKLPVNPVILYKIKAVLNFNNSADVVFWAACLVMFYGLFRKNNLFPDSVEKFNGEKQFMRKDFVISHTWIEISVRWSKTIQYKQRSYIVKLPLMYSHPLCPVSALVQAFQVSQPAEQDFPAFPDMSRINSKMPLTGSKFNLKLKQCLQKAGLPYANLSSHSFRRGGAVWALGCGVPGEIVKYMGDWKSTAYLKYLDQIPEDVVDYYRKKFACNLPLLTH